MIGEILLKPKLESISFDSLLIDPGRSSTISTGGVAIPFSLALAYRIPFGEKGFYGFELKGGYVYTLMKSGWKEEGLDVLNSPDSKQKL